MSRDVTTFWSGCYDCSTPCGFYMVHDHVWHQAWPEHRELRRELMVFWKPRQAIDPVLRRPCLELCFPCLEKRLGRKLTILDFPDRIPLNQGIFLGFEMAKRALREEQ